MYHGTTLINPIVAAGRRRQPTRTGVASVGWSTLGSIAARPVPILLCAAGFAAPGVLRVALDTPSLGAFIRGQSTACTFETLSGWQPWGWGVLGLLAHVLAHGMVTALASRGLPAADGEGSLGMSLRTAGRSVVARLPALWLGWLPHLLLIAAATAGLSVPLLGLRLDPVQSRAGVEVEDPLGHPVDLLVTLLGREIEVRVVNALLPDPGPLACGMAEAAQVRVFNRAPDPAGLAWQPAGTYRPPVYLAGWADTAGFWPMTLASLALLLGAGTLLRFRSAAVLAGAGRSPLAGLAGVGVVWRHLGTVTLQAGLLRSAIAGVQVCFIAVPTLLVEHLAIPWVGRAVWAPWVVPACVLGVAAGVAVVNSVLSAFAAVYDARLFAALRRAERGE